ncbi:hypothetical protein FNJ47_02545 [Bradyrhizobium sp. UFLA 03-164]|uniref:Uncharacterized protein n=1 Tax=Bradyrhizobium uaiense TaxID=2594946 RepID=A0A6P1BB88_9BRAD|nr:hypothetical protein [Bradyrhizobium uaiense]
MTRALQKITLSPSPDIPFNKLVLSQSNVRRVKAGVSIEQLAESVAQPTLLQSQSVRAVVDADGNEMSKTQVVLCVVCEGDIAEDDSVAKNDEWAGGLKVSVAWVANAPAVDASFAALMEGHTDLDLLEELQHRHVRVMGAHRIELSGFNDTMRDRLRAYGFFLGEIISWKLRMFAPMDASGAKVRSKVLDTYRIARISELEAA